MTAPVKSTENSRGSALAERLLALCADDTTTGREDLGLATLETQLRELGATIHRQAVEAGRTNVLATFGAPSRSRVLFSTHLDTVPPYFAPRREGARLIGRGTCDAKGQIVAHLEVIRRLRERGHHDVAWLGVVGEETDSIGAQRALELASIVPALELVIDGEPTENKLATGQRGIVQVELDCFGAAAHSGQPEKGHSAIHDLLDWLQRLRAEPGPVDPELGPEVFNIGRIEGGGALNVVPAHAAAKVMARTVPGSEFGARVARLAPPRGRSRVFHETPLDRYPAIGSLPRAAVPFGSDAPRLRKLAKGGAVALIGPGSIDVAHTDHEFLDLTDLAAGIDLLESLALRFLDPSP
jgi:acetylornithine deacetylase